MTSPTILRTALPIGALALLAAMSLPQELHAQSTVHGALAGIVVDGAGRPVHDAEVRISDRVSGAARRLNTGRDGAFLFGLLSPATYDLAVEALGFRPVRYLGVTVVAGTTPTIRIALKTEAPPVVRIDTVRAPGARAAPLSWLQARGYSDLVGGRRLASDAALLSTIADEESVEGLPWRFADLMVDGARLGALNAPGDPGSLTTALALPMRGLSEVRVGGMGYDIEAGGSGVGLNVLSLRGGGISSFRGATFGGNSDIGAAIVLGGAIQRDTAHAVVGIDYQRSAVTRPAWFLADDAEGTRIVDIARDSFATNLDAYRLETPRLEERSSGFGRLDWQLGDRYAISMRAAGSRLVVSDPPLLGGTATGFGSWQEANAAQLSLDVLSRVTPRVSAEIRLSGDVSDMSSNRPSVAPTAFVGRGVTVGAAPAEPSREQLTAPRVSAMAHWNLGVHRLKFGVVASTSRQESQGTAGALGSFAFGDTQDFAAGQGSWRGLAGNANSGNFSLSEASAFAQDAWTVSDGFAVTLGVRVDNQKVAAGDIELNSDWLAQTGLDNTAVSAARTRVAPRIGFRWVLGDTRAWVLEGGAGVYNGLPDRRDIGEALALDRGVEVRSAVGTLGSWPAAPNTLVAPSRGRTITVIGPGLEGPRTRRFTFGVLREIGDWNAYVKGGYRQTDFLSRRRDLNLPASASGADQYGRPLYGALQQLGTLVAAVPGSNRRFADFDAVTAIEMTGYSEFWNVTAGLERVVEQGLSLGLHYTYSRTQDNLAAGQRTLAPLQVGIDGGEWSDGRADTDAPHRVIAAAEWSPNQVLRIGAIFRLRSGTPYTAGFRDGVDANGDGVAGNDPAFVDASLPGMDALLAANACLRNAVGTFAERNSCSGEISHRLDLRAAFRVANLTGGPLDLVIDAMDVLAGATGRVDGALNLVDRTGTLAVGPGGVTTVPLMVNPNFGALLADRSPGILFRVGLRIGR